MSSEWCWLVSIPQGDLPRAHVTGHPVYPDHVTHVVLVRDAQFARHTQHTVPEHRVNGQCLARDLAHGALVIKQQILDIGAGASLK